MKGCISCKEAMRQCMDTHTFAFAHLYNDEKAMDMHIHDCYEIYYSISGGKQFLIDNYFYDISDGDIFLINQFESHYLTQIDQQKHERIILSIDPEYLKQISTENDRSESLFSVPRDRYAASAPPLRRRSRPGLSILSINCAPIPGSARTSWIVPHFWN